MTPIINLSHSRHMLGQAALARSMATTCERIGGSDLHVLLRSIALEFQRRAYVPERMADNSKQGRV